MSRDVQAVREMLTAYDPHPPSEGDDALMREADATLQRLLAADPAIPPRQRRAPLLVAAATAVAALVVLAALLWPSPRSPAYAATPSPLQLPPGPGRPARADLLRLAAVARKQQPQPAAPYRYLKLRAWYLNTRVDGESVQSQLQPEIVEQWLGDDGARRTVITRDGETDVVHHGPTRTSVLSSDPPRLARQLAGNAEIPDHVERVERTVDVLREHGTVPPALQAALWKVLAEQHLRSHGAIVDRGGRRGLAFTIDSAYSGLPTRDLLIIDPHTGRLLSFEQILTRDPGKLNVRVPSVTEYEIFVAAGTVDRLGARPVSSSAPPSAAASGS